MGRVNDVGPIVIGYPTNGRARDLSLQKYAVVVASKRRDEEQVDQATTIPTSWTLKVPFLAESAVRKTGVFGIGPRSNQTPFPSLASLVQKSVP